MKKLIVLSALLTFALLRAEPVQVTPRTNVVTTLSLPALRLNATQTQTALSAMSGSLSNANIVAFSPEVTGKIREINIRILPNGSSVTTFTATSTNRP